MEEIIKHINNTNASYRAVGAGNAKNTDLFLDNEYYEFFKDSGEQITVRFNKDNLTQAILFISSILPRKYDSSSKHLEIPFSQSFVIEQLEILNGFFMENGAVVENKNQIWNIRKDVQQKNGETDTRFYFNGLIEDFEYITPNGEHKKAKFTIRDYLAGGFSDLHIKKNEDGIFDILVTNTLRPYNDEKKDGYLANYNTVSDDESLQKIYYGTPGSGKSHKVNNLVENIYPEKAEREKYVVRTTFHPDSDYASFVGCYKPQMDGEKIKYEFTPQAFTDAYVKAWQEIKEESGKNVYLVIEEINRGNCAQIFGDLFQLLDRKNRVSEYPINADADLRQYLEGDDVIGKNSEGIAEGKLKLPSNLYIWATMNTSDQSLFPMDSAFKRRWAWECVPIDYDNPKSSKYTITIQGQQYNWHEFLRKVNAKIKDASDSEDKQMGTFFINGDVDERQFVDKVMFYLWNDVFKEEYKTSKNHFRISKEGVENGEEFTFNDLFDKKDKNKDSKLLIGFMKYLDAKPINNNSPKTTEEVITETDTDQ